MEGGFGGGPVGSLPEATQDEAQPDPGEGRVVDGGRVVGSHGASMADTAASPNIIHTIEQYLRLNFSLNVEV